MLDWSTTTGIACLIMFCGVVLSGLLSYEPHNWGKNWCNKTSSSLLWNDTLDCQTALRMGSYTDGLNEYSIRTSTAYAQCKQTIGNSTIGDITSPLEQGFKITPIDCDTCDGIIMRWFLNRNLVNAIYVCDTILDNINSDLTTFYCNDNAVLMATQYYDSITNNSVGDWRVELPDDYPTTCTAAISYYSGCHSGDITSKMVNLTKVAVWNGCGPSHALIDVVYELSTNAFRAYHYALYVLMGTPRARSSLINNGYTYNVTSTTNELFLGRAVDMNVRGEDTWDNIIQSVASTTIPTHLVEAITILTEIDKQYRGANALTKWVGTALYKAGGITYLTEPFYRTFCSYTDPTGSNAFTVSEVLCNASHA
jgi:hypothetical protein